MILIAHLIAAMGRLRRRYGERSDHCSRSSQREAIDDSRLSRSVSSASRGGSDLSSVNSPAARSAQSGRSGLMSHKLCGVAAETGVLQESTTLGDLL